MNITQKESEEMKSLFKNAVTSWKSTLVGGIPGLGMIVDGIATKNYGMAAGGLGLLLVSMFVNEHGEAA